MMRLLVIAALALSLSACSLFKDMPTATDIQKEIARAEVQIDGLMVLNYKFRTAEFIDKAQYDENIKGLSDARSQIETIKNLLDVGQLETAADRLEKVSEILHSLNPS